MKTHTWPILVSFAAGVAALGLTLSAAQSPTPSPTSQPQPTSVATSTATVVPTPTEPAFNWAIVKEVVVPLIGDDGRTHYVTLSQDTEGVVRVRLSLFYFQPGTYQVVLFNKGDCSPSATRTYTAPNDVIQSFPLDLGPQSASYLGLSFFNTRLISIVGDAPNSIYDADGTSLAIYRPASPSAGWSACASLSAPGAPAGGNSPPAGRTHSLPSLLLVAPAAGLMGLALLLAWRWRRRPS
jgi:hypothetical protein